MRLGHQLIARVIARARAQFRAAPHPISRPFAAVCLALTLLGSAQSGATRTRVIPGALAARRPASLGVTAPLAPGWAYFTYKGAAVPGGAARIPSYSLAYPPGWSAHLWPDTLAGYGQLDLRSPSGTTVDVTLIPLRPRGPAPADLVANDASYISQATRSSVVLPLGAATRLSGTLTPVSSGRSGQILYLRQGAIMYRLFSSRQIGLSARDMLIQIASTLRIPALAASPSGSPTPTPPAPQPPPTGGCCHCPVWGSGWGIILTRLDGVPVYWNAGDVDNGCDGTYGILYQCVELAQRYFAQRWGYPPTWAGVGAAADMPANHPGDIQFIPNGGSSGPREGDALIFFGGGFGHVAVVSGVDRRTGQITLVEENWSPTGAAALPIYADNTIGIRDSAYGSYTVAGWLHTPKNG
jgi:hypothetical protein